MCEFLRGYFLFFSRKVRHNDFTFSFSYSCSVLSARLISSLPTIVFYFIGDLGEADINVESLCWGTGEGEDAATFRDSMVGKIIGGDDKYTLARTAAEDDEAPEPLALLAIHAAMHMLFLPQFTCDFYEDEANDDDSLSSSESRDKKEEEAGFLARRRMEAEKEEEAKQAKVDNAMKNEAGLKKTKYAANGILLLPKPACIVWAGGCGVKSKKVCSPCTITLNILPFMDC